MNKISGGFSRILSVKFKMADTNGHLREVCRRIKAKRPTLIFTPNTQILLSAQKNRSESALLQKADISIPDGAGVYLASKMLGTPLPSRMGGIDFAERLLSLAKKNGLSVFLLGGKAGVAKVAAERLAERYPRLRICGTQHGYFQKHGSENASVVKKINRAAPDILFVCFGYPLQERWLVENISELACVRVAMGLGGSLDVWSGNIRRAPHVFQALGLEWLWRTALEPRRIKILLDIPHFLALVALQRGKF